ncbi:MAG TPA: hypothetical protein VHY37_04005 [Tepidisphaeraceae bacterium]|nr:hypothetical protein [Tepidisphaeraceae bacterium]
MAGAIGRRQKEARMGVLQNLVEQCVAAMRSRPSDLISLAQLHGDLQAIGERAQDRPEVFAAATQAAELVEKIVRGQSSDPAEAMRQIGVAIGRLQAVIGTELTNGGSRPAST